MLLIPFLYKLKSCANNSICKFISYISLISYSLYLVNLSLVSGIIIPYINQYYSSPYFNIFLFWGISILISSVLYKYFEIDVLLLIFESFEDVILFMAVS